MKNLFITLMALFFATQLFAQEKKWSLQDCIKHAYDNNIQVKQQALSLKNLELDVKQSKMDMLPTLNGAVGHDYSWGKSVDPFTNSFATDRIQGNSFSANSSVTLFNGFRKRNMREKRALAYEGGKMNSDKLLDDIGLQIASQYLNVLYSIESLEIAQNQIDITKQQVERTKKMVEAGTIAKGNLLNVEAQVATEQLQVVLAQNSLDVNYLMLAHLLDFPNADGFEIEKPDVALDNYMMTFEKASAVYQFALLNQPNIKSAEIDVQVAEKDIQIAKSSLTPSLELSGQIRSGYSGANKEGSDYVAVTQEIGYTQNNKIPVYTDTQIPSTYDPKGFSDQLSDNLSKYVGVSLRIPIFNGLAAKTQLSKAKLGRENSLYVLELEKQNLRKTIQQAYADAVAAKNKNQASAQKLLATKEAFMYAEKRFNVGMINFVEYNEAKKEFTNSKSELLRSKYEYLFKKTVLDFYMGKALDIN